MTVSIGLASLSQLKYQRSPQDSQRRKFVENLDKVLLGKADEALYQAKQTGRNQVVIKKMAR